jgi:hypothetical protein
VAEIERKECGEGRNKLAIADSGSTGTDSLSEFETGAGQMHGEGVKPDHSVMCSERVWLPVHFGRESHTF